PVASADAASLQARNAGRRLCPPRPAWQGDYRRRPAGRGARPQSSRRRGDQHEREDHDKERLVPRRGSFEVAAQAEAARTDPPVRGRGNVGRAAEEVSRLGEPAMNEICPFCGEPQRFRVDYMDTVVYCGKCAKPFLLTRRARDEVPRRTLSDREIRGILTVFFWGSLVAVFLLSHFLF